MVGAADEQLAERLAREPQRDRVSTFNDRATAERVVHDAIKSDQAGIKTWLEGGSNRPHPISWASTDGAPVGRSLARGASESTDAAKAKVVLKRDSSMPEGYKVLTTYPEP